MHCGAGVCADIVQMLGHHIFYYNTVHWHSAFVWKQPDVCRASGSGVGLGCCHILYLVCGLCYGGDLFLISCKFLAQFFSGLIHLLCCYHCHPLDNCILSASSNIRLLCGVCCFFHPFHVYVRVSNYGSETSSPLLPSVIGQWFSYDLCLCRNYPGSIELLLSMSSC